MSHTARVENERELGTRGLESKNRQVLAAQRARHAKTTDTCKDAHHPPRPHSPRKQRARRVKLTLHVKHQRGRIFDQEQPLRKARGSRRLCFGGDGGGMSAPFKTPFATAPYGTVVEPRKKHRTPFAHELIAAQP
jgi:hypothetical protein